MKISKLGFCRSVGIYGIGNNQIKESDLPWLKYFIKYRKSFWFLWTNQEAWAMTKSPITYIVGIHGMEINIWSSNIFVASIYARGYRFPFSAELLIWGEAFWYYWILFLVSPYLSTFPTPTHLQQDLLEIKYLVLQLIVMLSLVPKLYTSPL